MPQKRFSKVLGVFMLIGLFVCFSLYYINNPDLAYKVFPRKKLQWLEIEWDYDTTENREVKFEQIRWEDIFSYSVILVT